MFRVTLKIAASAWVFTVCRNAVLHRGASGAKADAVDTSNARVAANFIIVVKDR